ncbi:MAG: SUMF1/EgtB/PvdO family nonheme iron enzyme [Planctomycetes bacterium]|nr:SUMF1/EgtB/PvdO family nonheme iron enzyme [Planctomycetota bacterium]
MKPGLIGSVLVVLCGGAVVGAVVLRDQSQLARAKEARGAGDTKLQSGDFKAAEADYLKANQAAAQVGGIAGLRADAHAEAAAARRGLHLIHVLEGLKADPASGLRLLDGPFLEGFDPAPAPAEGLVARIRAEALLDAAVSLERRELIDLAAKLFPPAAEALAAVKSPRAAEADLGQRRLTTLRNLREAEEAVRNQRAVRAAKLVREALAALEGEGSPFKDPKRLEDMKTRLARVKRQAESGILVDEYQRRVDSLYKRVNGPDLGDLSSEAQDLEAAAPKLPGGHVLAEDHKQRVANLVIRIGRIRVAADEFAGMVWLQKTAKGSLYIEASEVTNGQYAAFVSATKAYATPTLEVWGPEGLARAKDRRFDDGGGGQGPKAWYKSALPEGQERYPVTGIGYLEAEAYARWAKRRLPTLEEFRAAAGGRRFPWGDKYEPGRANVNQRGGSRRTQPAGSYQRGQSSSGVQDLVGNAREIVTHEGHYVMIGGSYERRPAESALDARPLRCTIRLRAKDLGFRCVKELEWDD